MGPFDRRRAAGDVLEAGTASTPSPSRTEGSSPRTAIRRSSRSSAVPRSRSRRCRSYARGPISTTPRSRSRARRTCIGPTSSSRSAPAHEGGGDGGRPRVRTGADATRAQLLGQARGDAASLPRVTAGRPRAIGSPSHPCQEAMLAEVAAAAELDAASLPTAVDGCGVVTYALTLERMAHAFARLESLERRNTSRRRDASASRARPWAGAPDTELMRLGDGWVSKAVPRDCSARRATVSASRSSARTGRSARSRSRSPAPRPSSGSSSGDLADAPLTNSRGEVVGELRALRTEPAR